jgi:integrase
MPKIRTGYAYKGEAGKWWARFDYTDENGKRRTIRRRAENKTEAKELLRHLLQKHRENGQQLFDGERMIFDGLAAYYEKTYLKEPEYVNGRKVAGLRSAYDFRLRLDVLRQHFGKRKLGSITHDDIERFRAVRLQTPTRHGNQRSIATVNRELSLLRRVFNIAVRNGWMVKNPFAVSSCLITSGDEKPRERIITREEEARLLAACTGLRSHLRPIIVAALDTGMRRGELFKLTWNDIDLENRIITIRAFNTKTMRERQVAITERLATDLALIYEQSTKESAMLVFGIKDNVKNGFNTARRMAGLLDVRFHDLRHTHATRLVSAHMPLSEVGRVLGHTQISTTYRYVNANVETAQRAAAILDRFNSVLEIEESVSGRIN